MTDRKRRARDRRHFSRRQRDVYKEVGKLAGLIASAATAIVGQAELIGEPWRHYVTVVAVVCVAVWGYCMKPNAAKVLAFFKRK